ncbi:tRNA 4-thiouridine(8) synthase ThiI [Pasteurellaceae bacterium HPA106]|uniref:tRNA uracil 4-sulfurtransferase ThiI n=1 Tax=Spirabiliibacterium pneumoniae TaxID=221400 RepID=UPI001AAD1C0D|nr:tRNA uracil 4-sulfurtransferase ThiI [Spirabiliibacterium pneumoniae]MBE2896527.1 tRNA 4-thiouridine(8) synthase ThiI [Spirabiliibacterium pneumoniae]
MKFIIKLFPEVMVKSDSVRKRFIKILAGNIRNILNKQDDTVAVVHHWDYIEVRSKDVSKRDLLLDFLQRTPGIHHILEVEGIPFTSMHDIFEYTLKNTREQLENRTFCVRVKRKGKHDFSSLDLERYVGGGLNQHIETAKVRLKNPDVTVNITIEDDQMLLIKNRFEGIGGYPVGTQEDVLSLISGGFDSGVSSYMFIRRGSKVHYCFFNLGGQAHEIGVKQMAYHIWSRYSSSVKVRFVAINFEGVVAEILEKIDNGQMGVVLKRMMVRAASRVAERFGIQAIVTGEALGQVSSQTLTNLRLIDEAASVLVLRPLITHDKPQIIATAQQIGTDEIAKSMPEFCGVISKNPTVKAIPERIIKEEAHFDFTVLDEAVAGAQYLDIRDIANADKSAVEDVEIVDKVGLDEVVIDVRSEEEREDKPMYLPECELLAIPFFKLGSAFAQLDRNTTYLLYCEKGVMSQLQAQFLHQQGYDNVKVLRLR